MTDQGRILSYMHISARNQNPVRFLGIHETLSGSGNPFTTLNNTSKKDTEYNFGSYNESYDIWRKILDRYGYRDTPIINLESSAIMTGKQDAELVQRAVFARINSSRNRLRDGYSRSLPVEKFTKAGNERDQRRYRKARERNVFT